jgi:hypothetical protein
MRKILIFAILLTTMLSGSASATWLKQATSATIKLKPVYVFATGVRKTAGITLHAAHILVSINGGASGPKHDATAPTVEAVTGQRVVTLDATDTATLGRLIVDWPDDVNGVTSPEFFDVVDPNVYNTMFLTGEYDVYSARGSRTTMDNLKLLYDTHAAAHFDPNWHDLVEVKHISAGANALGSEDIRNLLTTEPATTVATVTSASEFTLTAGSAVNDYYNGAMIVIEDLSDSNRKAPRFIRDYTGATKKVYTDEAFPFTPAAADIVHIYLNRAVGRGRVSP